MGYLLTKEKCRNKVNPHHSLEEIMDIDEYSAFRDGINDCFRTLEDWQRIVLDLLSNCKQTLHDHFVAQQSKEAQVCLMNYLKLRVLYGLAYHVAGQINDQISHLISCYDNNQEGVDEIKKAILNLIEYFVQMPYIDIVQDEVTGFFRLQQTIEGFKQRVDFPVLESMDSNGKHITWSYRDIIGTIANYGLHYESLWITAAKGLEPTESNIVCFLENEEDND